MKKSQAASRDKTLKDIDEWTAGKKKFRMTLVDEDRSRSVFHASKPELASRQEKMQLFKSIRLRIGLTRDEIAAALHVSPRTVEGWEVGRRIIPEPVFILVQLLHDVPAVKKRLLAA